ncbi:shikimate kinase AroK [Aquisalimonas sp.]|uniref:shikimate kinase AroK n=1 Tax=unclassified Aquisalimonas TaxID=2644645 RepID=UPI0025C56D43|nr:shikimate kinase AroK [Aquisalimonas sp.]
MSQSRHLFLIGPMGAGKSTIGRRLARALELPFVDSDQVIQERTGVDIPRIFDVEGEAGFRQREKAVIDELTAGSPAVLATGGGAVLDPENRHHLRERGTVVYLQTSVDEQLRRTGKDKRRPLLQTADPRARLEALLTERDPLYRETAHLTISTEQGNIGQVVRRILDTLDSQRHDHHA